MYRPDSLAAAAAMLAILLATTPVSAQDPSEIGKWGPVLPFPHVAVHMAMMHTGKLIFWAYSVGEVSTWDPGSGTFTTIPSP